MSVPRRTGSTSSRVTLSVPNDRSLPLLLDLKVLSIPPSGHYRRTQSRQASLRSKKMAPLAFTDETNPTTPSFPQGLRRFLVCLLLFTAHKSRELRVDSLSLPCADSLARAPSVTPSLSLMYQRLSVSLLSRHLCSQDATTATKAPTAVQQYKSACASHLRQPHLLPEHTQGLPKLHHLCQLSAATKAILASKHSAFLSKALRPKPRSPT